MPQSQPTLQSLIDTFPPAPAYPGSKPNQMAYLQWVAAYAQLRAAKAQEDFAALAVRAGIFQNQVNSGGVQ